MADKHVKLDGRRFIIKFDTGGRPRAIYERKVYQPGTHMEALYDAAMWHRNHDKGRMDNPKTLPARIMAAAQGDAK